MVTAALTKEKTVLAIIPFLFKKNRNTVEGEKEGGRGGNYVKYRFICLKKQYWEV